jgi:integrase
MEYLSLKGYDVFLMHDIYFKATDFQPHIYTDDEIRRYFEAVDSYSSGKSRMDVIQLPVLFRLLYCCGTRINETLGIRKRDVDLDSGIIRLLETKNNCERFVVLNPEMKALLSQFSDKCFYLLDNDDYIFSSVAGTRRDESGLYNIHRLILQRAGIPYLGGGHGPRVHDWRHTFAVRSFKQMLDLGLDMYVALPVLSTYLGHKTIYATERYIRLTMDLYPYINEKCSAKFQSVFGKAADINETD